MPKWSLRNWKWGQSVTAVLVFSLAIIFITVFLLGQAAGANSTIVPGSESDPLVTASWVEAKINERLGQLEGNGLDTPPAPGEPVYVTVPAPTYQVVEVFSGQRMLTGAGTEIIMRSGYAKVIEGPGGGLSDLTSGTNLFDGTDLNKDHLLLSSRDDGRGIIAESNCFFMVRGDYNIE